MARPTQTMSASSGERRNTPSLTKSELYGLLSSPTRRHVFDILADREEPLGLSELARLIAERDDGEASEPDEPTDRRVIGLHHKHLPKLEDAGLIRYDGESKRIEALHDVETELGVPKLKTA